MFFKKAKPSIKSVYLPDWGWQEVPAEPNQRKLVKPDQSMVLNLFYFELEPDLPGLDIDTMRKFFRERVAAHGGGLIEVEMTKLGEYPAVRTIFKFPIQPSGMIYLGSYTIPFSDRNYVLRIESPELGVTGIRDSTIVVEMQQENKVGWDEEGNLTGWFEDPYDPEFTGGMPMNLSERVEYDERFPSHCLTLLREHMEYLELQVGFGKELRSLSPFI